MIKTFGKDSVIYREGTPATEVYRIISGTVRCTRLFNKIEKIDIGEFEPGAFLGLVSVMLGTSHVETATANTRIELEVYKKTDFERLITYQPEIGLEILTKLSAQIRELNKLIKGVGTTSSNEKPVTDDLKLMGIGEHFFNLERYVAAGYVFSRYLELYPTGTYITEAPTKA